jgi:hypothetical protein
MLPRPVRRAIAWCTLILQVLSLQGLWQTAARADTGAAIAMLDAALAAGGHSVVRAAVDNGHCTTQQVAHWTHYLNDADEMVLGLLSECQIGSKSAERAESPVRFNMLDVSVARDEDTVVLSCRDYVPCMTVEPGGGYPMGGERVFVWTFKPVVAGYAASLAAAFEAGKDAQRQLVADNAMIDAQIAAARLANGVAAAGGPRRE